MPHIKSIRLVNVHFNNATQFYDDFYLEPAGKNTTYDLENGGGKSLLLMMILQVVLPKSYLRKEKPLSLLFQGGRDRTSHVAVEWILEEGEQYRYLLTGFSARKRKGLSEGSVAEGLEEEENLQSADIEHLSWLVFYNDNRFTGCKAVPLARQEGGQKRYAGFDDIRKYIQQMRQKGLPAEVFDRIDRYQHYIAAHHLLAAEWNIIKGINSGENNIESYFRQNATSRKLIENLFVKIVEDMEALNKGDKNRDESLLLADTLIEIRNRLNEYLKLKSHLAEFTGIKAYYSEFGQRNEELLAAFQQFEAGKSLAAAVYNLIGRKLQALEQETGQIRARLAEHTAGSEQAKQLKKLLEAGLVNLQKEDLQAEEHRQVELRDRLEDSQRKLERELNRLLALEGYGDYRTVKEKIAELSRRLEILAAGADSLQAEYREAGGQLKFLSDRRLAELVQLQEEAQKARDGLEKQREDVQQDLIAARENAAVLKAAVKGLHRQETALAGRLQELSGFFQQAGELDAVLSPDIYEERLQRELDGYQAETGVLTGRLSELATELQDAGLALVRVENEIKERRSARERVEAWLAAYRKERAALEEKAQVWGQAGIEEYREALQQALHRESLRRLETEIEAGRMRQKKQLSQDRGFYVPNEEILALAGQLSAKCPYVEAGIEWIDRAEAPEKERLLREMPYLPYSVIVDRESFTRLQKGRIKLDFSSDYPVPVVNVELLRGGPGIGGEGLSGGNSSGESLSGAGISGGSSSKESISKEGLSEKRLSGENHGEILSGDGLSGKSLSRENLSAAGIYYFCSFAGLLLDKGEYDRYIRGMEEKIQALDREVLAAEARIAEINADLNEVALFVDKYPPAAVAGREKEVADLAQEIAVRQTRLQEIKDGQERFKEERERCNRRLEELAGLAARSREKIEKFAEKRQKETELAGLREQLQAQRRELDAVDGSIDGLKADAARLKQQYREEEERLGGLKQEVYEARQENESLAGFAAVECNLPLGQARAAFKALHEAVGGRNAEESDLRNSLRENGERLDKLRDRILRDYGEDLEDLAESESAGLLVIAPSQEQIKGARQVKEENESRLAEVGRSIMEISGRIKILEGKLEEILKDFTEEQKSALPRYDNESRYRQEIDRAGQLIESYGQRIQSAGAELEEKREEAGRLSRQQEDYRAFLEREAVAADGTAASEIVAGDGTVASEIVDFRQFEKEYYRSRDAIQGLYAKWDERLKTIQAETAAYVIREPLEELANIDKPVSAAQCLNRQGAFDEYLANIEEQMQKITDDISRLESYQEDFTRRCVQRAELVLGHMRKLETLSRIEVYGRRINMVELKIQEFEEKDKKLRMKEHIDGIVREIGEEGQVDRKRVAARLSTRELLARIADMDKAAVRLYKVESIPENSRFYRWEHAIGSEGQNNSLYFIFAACLISFIRMLSITNSSVRTRKVMIVDNPFGATSAVYLWEPMFKILQQNDIQLIAPGHRIPREITSRFAVSYLLNQDILQDGRRRVVVKDVRSEEDESVLRYVEPEQMAMF
jgi:hypothetical protein